MALPEVGLVESVTRGYRFANGDKQQPTIRPTHAFTVRLSPSLNDWEAFGRAEEVEVLLLKSSKDRETSQGENIEYADTRETRRMRKEVQRINSYLRNAPVKIVGNGGPVGIGENGQPIDPTRRAYGASSTMRAGEKAVVCSMAFGSPCGGRIALSS